MDNTVLVELAAARDLAAGTIRGNSNPGVYAYALARLEDSVTRAVEKLLRSPPSDTASIWRERCEDCESRMRATAAALRQVADSHPAAAEDLKRLADELVEWGHE